VIGAAFYFEGDNAQPGIVEALLGEIANFGTASVKRIYGDWTGTRLNGWKEMLLQHSIALLLFAGTHILRNLSETLRPLTAPAAVTTSKSPDGAVSVRAEPPVNPSTRAPMLPQQLFPNTHAALEQASTNARLLEEERAAQRQLTWEASLMCAYSIDTGRCQ